MMTTSVKIDTSPVTEFLACPTPSAWVERALLELSTLLTDHANCEKKAAATAMNLMYKYVDKEELLQKMAQLAREELLHFEQVVRLMKRREIPYTHIGPSRYASSLREQMRHHEPEKLVDTLIIGAFVEARSCERFSVLAPQLDSEISKFYQSLLKAECRHFEYYLELARLYSPAPIEDRIGFFRKLEAELINTPDPNFRFHSGVPV